MQSWYSVLNSDAISFEHFILIFECMLFIFNLSSPGIGTMTAGDLPILFISLAQNLESCLEHTRNTINICKVMDKW